MNAIRAVCFSFCLAATLHSYAQAPAPDSNCTPPNHSPWSELLLAYVDSTGWVNYKGFVQDSVKLNKYLTNLSNCTPSAKWNKEEKLAYWINVYNAFTVKLIVEHYPVASIKDIKKGIPCSNLAQTMRKHDFPRDFRDFRTFSIGSPYSTGSPI